MSPLKVFVCGATGTQGGALIDNLVGHGTEIHAITRNIKSEIAQKIQSQGVALTEGDFDNEESLKKSMTGCTTLFLNLQPNHTNLTVEPEQAQRVLSVAKESGVEHVIYSSVLGATNIERIPHCDPNGLVGKILLSKEAIEKQVRQAGFKQWTIARPGNFMSNYLNPLVRMYQGLVETGTFTTALSRETVIHMVDPNDIGKLAAAAAKDPVKFDRKEIEIMSEMMRVEEVMRDLSAATGKDLKANFLSEKELKEQIPRNPLLGAQMAMRDMPQLVRPEQVKCWEIELGTFAQFLEREKVRVEETYL
ncbi:uncharacterized protein PFLUO_LOCUS4399 [Penicillium psychrofluorescens]|uniref:uncharacterized protein n=1 Tax=Penicillium psychrofluorescens TaxID=3158075 RepID=UPI003CCD36DD